MSLLFADSFDHYPGTGAGKWYWGGGGAIVTSPVRTGTRAMGGGSNGPAYYPGTLTHFIVGVGVCFGSAPSATHYASFTDNSGGDSNVNLYLSAAADGSLGLGCSWGYGAYGSDTHWGSTAAGVIADFTAYNYIELEYLVAVSGGIIKLWVDGILRCSVSGNTVGANSSARVQLITLNTNKSGVCYDDFYLLDCTTTPNTTPFGGGTKIIAIAPNADSSPLQWTPSVGGDHFSLENTLPYDTSKYVSSNAVGQIDQYLQSLGAIPSGYVPLAVQHCMVAKLSGSGSASIVSNVGGVASSSVAALTTSWAIGFWPYDVDPATGLAWTKAGLPSRGFGPKVIVGGGVNAQVCQSVIEVICAAPPPSTFRASFLG